MFKRFFARLFGRRTEPDLAPRITTPASPVAPRLSGPPPPPPPPPKPVVLTPTEPQTAHPVPEPAEEAPPLPAGTPPEGHVRLILSDGTVVDPPVDADFEERLRYLSDNVLKRRNRPTT